MAYQRVSSTQKHRRGDEDTLEIEDPGPFYRYKAFSLVSVCLALLLLIVSAMPVWAADPDDADGIWIVTKAPDDPGTDIGTTLFDIGKSLVVGQLSAELWIIENGTLVLHDEDERKLSIVEFNGRHLVAREATSGSPITIELDLDASLTNFRATWRRDQAVRKLKGRLPLGQARLRQKLAATAASIPSATPMPDPASQSLIASLEQQLKDSEAEKLRLRQRLDERNKAIPSAARGDNAHQAASAPIDATSTLADCQPKPGQSAIVVETPATKQVGNVVRIAVASGNRYVTIEGRAWLQSGVREVDVAGQPAALGTCGKFVANVLLDNLPARPRIVAVGRDNTTSQMEIDIVR